MSIKKRGLGRGLDVLLTSRVVESEKEAQIHVLSLKSLTPNTYQPRAHFDPVALEELAASIKAQGLIQPILVRPLSIPGQYEIVAGERRWRACALAGLTHAECIVRDMDEHESMAIALIENLQREDLNPMEEARALAQVQQHFELTQDQLADKIGRSRPAITNCLRLLKLPETIQAMLENQSLSTGHARALLGLDQAKDMEKLAALVLEKGLTVRATEALVKKHKQAPNPKKTPPPLEHHFSGLLETLGTRYRVSHVGSQHKGKVVFSYANAQEREKLTNLLNKMALENK